MTPQSATNLAQPVTLAETLTKLKNHEITLIDIRNEEERNTAYIPFTIWIPMDELAEKLPALNPMPKEIVLHCHTHGRASQACETLLANGWDQSKIGYLQNGIVGWAQSGLPLESPHHHHDGCGCDH